MARRIIENLAKSADADLRASAQTLQSRIEKIEEREKQIAEYKKQLSEPNGLSTSAPRIIPESEDEITPEDEAAVETLRNRRMNENIYTPGTNEIRAAGYLSAVNCKPSAAVVFNVRVGDKILHLGKTELDSLKLRSFSAETQNLMIGCDAIKKDYYVVIIYKPAPNAKMKIDGELMSIEFMPPEFKLIL